MKPRLFGAAAVLTLTSFVGATALATTASAAPSQASAQQTAAAPSTGSLSTSIPCTINGVDQTCTLTITRFVRAGNTIAAVGTVTGGGVTVPFQAPVQATTTSAVQAAAVSPLQATATCGILDLTLGPLDLDLLGLVVHLDTVHLTIDAQSGSGNLLGNLLCAVAGLLDNNPTTALLNSIVSLLNQILAAL